MEGVETGIRNIPDPVERVATDMQYNRTFEFVHQLAMNGLQEIPVSRWSSIAVRAAFALNDR